MCHAASVGQLKSGPPQPVGGGCRCTHSTLSSPYRPVGSYVLLAFPLFGSLPVAIARLSKVTPELYENQCKNDRISKRVWLAFTPQLDIELVSVFDYYNSNFR